MSGAKVLGIKKKAVTFVSWEKRIDFLNFIFFKWVNNKFDYVTQVDIKQTFENVTNHNIQLFFHCDSLFLQSDKIQRSN